MRPASARVASSLTPAQSAVRRRAGSAAAAAAAVLRVVRTCAACQQYVQLAWCARATRTPRASSRRPRHRHLHVHRQLHLHSCLRPCLPLHCRHVLHRHRSRGDRLRVRQENRLRHLAFQHRPRATPPRRVTRPASARVASCLTRAPSAVRQNVGSAAAAAAVVLRAVSGCAARRRSPLPGCFARATRTPRASSQTVIRRLRYRNPCSLRLRHPNPRHRCPLRLRLLAKPRTRLLRFRRCHHC